MSVEARELPWNKQWASYRYEGRGAKADAKRAAKAGRRYNPGSFHMEGAKRVWDVDPHWERRAEGSKRGKWGDFMTTSRVDIGELSEEYKKDKSFKHATSPADFVDYSFNQDTDNVAVAEVGTDLIKDGHIGRLEYNTRTLVLRVTFNTNGSVVAYMGVPSTVVGELFVHATTKDTMNSLYQPGKQVHVLGSRFWDLIRYRGSIHGGRYEFAYTEDQGSNNLVGRGNVPLARGEGHKNRPSRLSEFKKEDRLDRMSNKLGPEDIDDIAERVLASFDDPHPIKKDVLKDGVYTSENFKPSEIRELKNLYEGADYDKGYAAVFDKLKEWMPKQFGEFKYDPNFSADSDEADTAITNNSYNFGNTKDNVYGAHSAGRQRTY